MRQKVHTCIFIFFKGFNETYDNLTFKTLSILYWVHHRVTHGRFHPKWIFKCDDDNLVDIYSFEHYFKTLELTIGTEANEIHCFVRDDAVPLRPGNAAIQGKFWIIHKIRFVSWFFSWSKLWAFAEVIYLSPFKEARVTK